MAEGGVSAETVTALAEGGVVETLLVVLGSSVFDDAAPVFETSPGELGSL